MKLAKMSNLRLAERGATMVEFALVGSLILVFVLAIFDVSRYLLARNVLTKAAQTAAHLAKKNQDLSLEYRDPYNNYQDVLTVEAAKSAVLDEALAVPLATMFSSSDSGSSMRLFSYSTWSSAYTTHDRDGLLLLPGEKAEVMDQIEMGSSTYSYTYSFPIETLVHPTCWACTEWKTKGKKGLEETWLNHPIIAEVRAKVPLLLLANRSVVVTGRAVVWREVVPTGIDQAKPLLELTSLCKESYDKNSWCAELGCDETAEKCIFSAYARMPSCGYCSARRCYEKWGQQQNNTFCETQSCGADEKCAYDHQADLGNCGGCQAITCKDFATESEACGTLACEVREKCVFFPDGGEPCSGCVRLKCKEFTNRRDACAAANCEDQGTSKPKDCKWQPDSRYSCTRCVREGRDCEELTDRDSVCSACISSAPQRCIWNPYGEDLNSCGGCVDECPKADGCTNWLYYPDCRCCDVRECPPNKVWDVDRCRCVRKPTAG